MKKNLETAFDPRQYMLSRDFEIYYYNDRNFSNVDPHTHNYSEFYFFLEGDASLHVKGQHWTLHPGDTILIPPGVSHYIHVKNADVPYRRFVLWVSQDYFDELPRDYHYWSEQVQETGRYIFHYDVIAFNSLQPKVFRLIEELRSQRFGKAAMLSLCLHDLLLHLNRAVYEAGNPLPAMEAPSLYQNLLHYIEDHLEDDLSLDALSRRFFVSKYHIAHIFKDNLGLSLHQYILKKRLAKCRDAICSGKDATETCLLWGFNDYSNFYRAFKKEYGVAPSEVKNTTLTNPDK